MLRDGVGVITRPDPEYEEDSGKLTLKHLIRDRQTMATYHFQVYSGVQIG
jgi:hypothetical protein